MTKINDDSQKEIVIVDNKKKFEWKFENKWHVLFVIWMGYIIAFNFSLFFVIYQGLSFDVFKRLLFFSLFLSIINYLVVKFFMKCFSKNVFLIACLAVIDITPFGYFHYINTYFIKKRTFHLIFESDLLSSNDVTAMLYSGVISVILFSLTAIVFSFEENDKFRTPSQGKWLSAIGLAAGLIITKFVLFYLFQILRFLFFISMKSFF